MSHLLKRQLYRWLLFGIGCVLLFVLIKHNGPGQILDKIWHVEMGWVFVTILCLVFSTLLGAINVYLILGSRQNLAFISFLQVYWLSWAIGLVAPGQVGDLATISLVLKKRGMNFSLILGRSLLDKLISLAVMLCIAIYGLVIFFRETPWAWAWPLWQIALLGGGVFVLVVFWRWTWMKKIFYFGEKGWLASISQALRELVLAIKHAPERIALNGFITLIKICLVGLAYWSMFNSLGHKTLKVEDTIAFATLAGLAAYLPISLNGVGTVEAAGIPLFGQLGIPSAEVLAAYLCLRIFVLGLAWVPTLLWIMVAPRLSPVESKHEQRTL